MAEDMQPVPPPLSSEEHAKLVADFEAKTREQKQYYNGLIEKSNEHFEKQLIYVSAGTLTASVFIIEKFFKASAVKYYDLIFYSWVFIGLTIVLNLVSHYVGIKVYLWIHRRIPATTDDEAKKANKKINWVRRFNLVSLIIYLLGLTLFLIFVKLNINNMNKTTANDLNKSNQNIEKGLEAQQIQVTPKPPIQQPTSPTPVPPSSQPASTPNQ